MPAPKYTSFDPYAGKPAYARPPISPISPRQPDDMGQHFPGQPNVDQGGFYGLPDAHGRYPVVEPPIPYGPDGSNPYAPQVPTSIPPPAPAPSVQPPMDPVGQGPGSQAPTFAPPGVSSGRNYGTFRSISQRGGPEFRPSNTQELLRKAAARRLGLD